MTTPTEVVDMFISDVLLPTTASDKVIETKILYEYYKQYCEYAEMDPVSIHHFGRCLANRFVRSRRKGISFYKCELNPRVQSEGNNE
jgi:hypothetical protein